MVSKLIHHCIKPPTVCINRFMVMCDFCGELPYAHDPEWLKNTDEEAKRVNSFIITNFLTVKGAGKPKKCE